MKIALAQISCDPGKIQNNLNKIQDCVKKATNLGAELIVFPELSIPGYTHLDLANHNSYIEQNRQALISLQPLSQNISIIVGHIEVEGGALYNSAAVLASGKIQESVRKCLLPNYDIFFEPRYFTSSATPKVLDLIGHKIGIQICEDLWDENYVHKISSSQIAQGAELIINLSASPYELGKFERRLNQAAKHPVPFVFCNSVGGFDGFYGEVLFDGQSFIRHPSGTFWAYGSKFKEDLVIADLTSTPALNSPLPNVNQNEELAMALIFGIREFCRRQGFKKLLVGVSGGIDSALVLALAERALGANNIIAITMPSPYTSFETLNDARQLARNLKIELIEHSIHSIFEQTLTELRRNSTYQSLPEDVTEENLQSRIRMNILMSYANKFSSLLLNTGNRTELALGYCTIYGDMAGGLAVLGDLNKIEVYSVAKLFKEIPQSILTRPPTAELRHNQTDAQGMGAEPVEIAELVDEIIKTPSSLQDIQTKYSNRFSSTLIEKIWKNIQLAEWKRRQSPPALRVSSQCFGLGRRLPMGRFG